ncbi:MAG: FimV/HubP family polar landmark protein [Thiogranum sp.]
MFRKSALVVAMFGVLAGTNAFALGLGEIELKSALNQPLDAEVELLSATSQELQNLKVSVAPAQAFANAGIERPLFLNKLQFAVMTNAAGKPVVHITSKDAVREPFLDFLLEMSWSKGRLVREYTVLVDPPVTMPAEAPPVTTAPASRVATSAAAEPMAPASSGRIGHAAKLPPVSVSANGEYRVQRNDTLWGVAEAVRPDNGVSVEQTMMALLQANPEAFVDGNINNLKAGYVLRIPERDAFTAMSQSDAVREARAQYRTWRAAHNELPTEGGEGGLVAEGGAAGSADTAAGSEPNLELLAPAASVETSGVQGGEGLEAVKRDLMLANEALEEQRRQNEEMTGRLAMLEEQVANMSRLIQLKDEEMARLQAMAAGESATQPVPSEAAENSDTTAAADADRSEAPAAPAMPEEGEAGPALGESGDALAGMPIEMGSVVDEPPAEQGEVALNDALPIGDVAADMPMDETPGMTGSEDFGIPEMSGAESVEPLADAAPGEPVAPMGPVEGNETAPAAVLPGDAAMVETEPAPGFVDQLLAKPLWLGSGALVLGLLAFMGLRRKRGVETEFQESILQAAAHKGASESDSVITDAQPESTDSKPPESSLLSEFAVSDMGSISNDGAADPMAEADVYLAYGRYQQAEDLIKEALEKEPGRSDLNLKMLEIFAAGRNQAAFDHHAQAMLEGPEDSGVAVWEKIAEMGRELSPHNPLYQSDAAPEHDTPEAVQDETQRAFEDETQPLFEDEPRGEDDERGLDFDLDLSYDPHADADRPDSMEFTPPEASPETDDADSQPDTSARDEAPEFNLEDYDMEVSAEPDEEAEGDGELTELDEVSTKLDLARAYIDMGDSDGAKSILDEVMEEGSDNQRDEARDIMEQLS